MPIYQIGSCISFDISLSEELILHEVYLLSIAGYRFTVTEYPEFIQLRITSITGN